MAIDGWEWAWSGEHQRARMLRDALADASSSAAASTRRLNSKLSKLEGSLQRKLDALSTAFDAFVELGDIREQLQELPDWSHTRRAVEATLTTLMAGEQPAPLDPVEHQHWLADAMNAVVALVGGADPGEFERRALQDSDDASMFIVTTLLALDSGTHADGRLAAVLDGAEALDEDRLMLLRAAALGLASPAELARIGDGLAPALANVDTWRAWLELNPESRKQHEVLEAFLEHGTVARKRTSWVSTAGRPQAQGWDRQQLEEQLVQRAGVLARSGSREEAELRSRAVQLRERIEDPTGEQPRAAQEMSVALAIQDILEHPDVPDESRRIIIGWLHQPLAEIVRGWRELGPGPGAVETHRLVWGPQHLSASVKVGTDGPDREQLRTAERRIQSAEPEKGHANAFLGGAAAAAALGLLTMLGGDGWVFLAVVLLVGAVALAVVGVLRKRATVQFEAAKSEAINNLRTGVKQRADELREKDAQRLEEERLLDQSLDALLSRLT